MSVTGWTRVTDFLDKSGGYLQLDSQRPGTGVAPPGASREQLYDALSQLVKNALENMYSRGVVKREDVDERALEYLSSLPGQIGQNAVEELARANLAGKSGQSPAVSSGRRSANVVLDWLPTQYKNLAKGVPSRENRRSSI
eukprot:810862-Prorocentrum_minimum.AAC.3